MYESRQRIKGCRFIRNQLESLAKPKDPLRGSYHVTILYISCISPPSSMMRPLRKNPLSETILINGHIIGSLNVKNVWFTLSELIALRAPDKMRKINFNQHYLRYFFVKFILCLTTCKNRHCEILAFDVQIGIVGRKISTISRSMCP